MLCRIPLVCCLYESYHSSALHVPTHQPCLFWINTFFFSTRHMRTTSQFASKLFEESLFWNIDGQNSIWMCIPHKYILSDENWNGFSFCFSCIISAVKWLSNAFCIRSSFLSFCHFTSHLHFIFYFRVWLMQISSVCAFYSNREVHPCYIDYREASISQFHWKLTLQTLELHTNSFHSRHFRTQWNFSCPDPDTSLFGSMVIFYNVCVTMSEFDCVFTFAVWRSNI